MKISQSMISIPISSTKCFNLDVDSINKYPFFYLSVSICRWVPILKTLQSELHSKAQQNLRSIQFHLL